MVQTSEKMMEDPKKWREGMIEDIKERIHKDKGSKQYNYAWGHDFEDDWGSKKMMKDL